MIKINLYEEQYDLYLNKIRSICYNSSACCYYNRYEFKHLYYEYLNNSYLHIIEEFK
jgi:hypothetical protein